jgi:hypothetical protein
VHLLSIGHPIENDKVYRTIYELSKATPKAPIAGDKGKFHDIPYSVDAKGWIIPDVSSDDFEELYLHAYKYKFSTYAFKTPYPSWALTLLSATTPPT